MADDPTPPSPPSKGAAEEGLAPLQPPPLDLQLARQRTTKKSPLQVHTPKLSVLSSEQISPSGVFADDIGAKQFENPLEVDENDVIDGYSAEQIFNSPGSRGYTFDDVIVLQETKRQAESEHAMAVQHGE